MCSKGTDRAILRHKFKRKNKFTVPRAPQVIDLKIREAFLLALKSYRQNKEEEALAVLWYDDHWVQRAAQLDDDLVALCIAKGVKKISVIEAHLEAVAVNFARKCIGSAADSCCTGEFDLVLTEYTSDRAL